MFKGARQVSVYFRIHLLNMHMEMHYNYNTLGSTHITIYNINIQTEKQAFLLCILRPRASEATTSPSSRRCVLLEALKTIHDPPVSTAQGLGLQA